MVRGQTQRQWEGKEFRNRLMQIQPVFILQSKAQCRNNSLLMTVFKQLNTHLQIYEPDHKTHYLYINE